MTCVSSSNFFILSELSTIRVKDLEEVSTQPLSELTINQKNNFYLAEIYFWSQRESRHACFDSNMHSGDRTVSTEYDRAIEMTGGIRSFEDVGSVKISNDGRISVSNY